MSVILGFDSNELKAAPGWKANRGDNNSWTSTHEFTCRAVDFDDAISQFPKGAPLGDLDEDIPEPFASFLKIDTVELTRIEGDLYTFNVTAIGNQTNQYEGDELSPDAEPIYDLQGRLIDLPLSEHPKWKILADNEKDSLENLLSGKYTYDSEDNQLKVTNDKGVEKTVVISKQLQSEDSIKFAKYIVSGTITYTDCQLVWTETTEGEQQLNPQQLAKLAKISNPRGNPPMPPNKNWMLTGVSQSQTGEIFRTTLEWTSSAREKWDEFLYE